MKRYFSEGNPYFRYKIKTEYPISEAIDWCDNYPTRTKDGYFERYYIDFGGVADSNYVTFQFEWEEPAIMFALKFGLT